MLFLMGDDYPKAATGYGYMPQPHLFIKQPYDHPECDKYS